MIQEKYYLGLDIGTDSLGWAVTDQQYNVVKKSGKALWGVRQFESGKTAVERRLARSTRRRQGRKKVRLSLLKEIFDAEISQIDNSFFARLSESKYHQEDKLVDGLNCLFNDSGYKDKQYHKKYPTIYHLRHELMNTKEQKDIRLVYLATAHIIKNRGHFLFENQNLEETTSFNSVFKEFKAIIFDELGIEVEEMCKNEISKILSDENLLVLAKKKALQPFFKNTKEHLGISERQNNTSKAIVSLISGGKTTFSELFDDHALKNELITQITFASSQFDDEADGIEEVLKERRFEVLKKIKALYDWSIFTKILKGKSSVSEAKIEIYNKHKNDLHILKRIFKTHLKSSYYAVFRSKKQKNNYCCYIGSEKSSGEKIALQKCDKEEFYKFLKSILTDIKDKEDEEVKYVLEEMEKGTFLPKQITKDNGVIPYQANLLELEKILKNMSRFYPFFNQKDENGYTPYEKILKILLFRIPYYVGPLNDAHAQKGFCWVVKKSNDRIFPWNFDDVIDKEKSAENFITRMTSTCTYLIGEDTLPKNSLLYSEFTVLNELNNLKINGEKIDVELKQNIFENLFKKNKKVTMKALLKFLEKNGTKVEPDNISGLDGDFKSNLSSYIDFSNLLGEQFDTEKIEECIKAITIFGESKNMLRNKVKKILEDLASEKEIEKICGFKYSGWGALSKKLLMGIYQVDEATGECLSIRNRLYNTNDNFMQLLSSSYEFGEQIKIFNADLQPTNLETYNDLVANIYTSPAVKRSIWQSLKIEKEIEKIMGCAPAKIFIEMARGAMGSQKNKRSVSRKEALKACYKSCKSDVEEWLKSLEGTSDEKLRSDRLYLYYTQKGKCMYSGESIEIEDLFRENIYDIDHIYPQSKVKDDSIDNRVLVKRTLNAKKDNKYPLPKAYRQVELWNQLLISGLITKEKFRRLMRMNPFTEDELAGFINRQLVETRQSTKAVAEVFSRIKSETTEVVYVKAGLISDFRNEFRFVKCREINDYHHAKDAYLSIVVGNVYNEKFTKDALRFIKTGEEYSVNVKTLFKKWDIVKRNEVIWRKGEDGSIVTVKRQMSKNNILMTKQALTQSGQLFDLMPVKKGEAQIPLKTSDSRIKDTEKYGGYKKVKNAHFSIVRHELKGKSILTIEAIPIYIHANGEKEAIKDYLVGIGLKNVDVLIAQVKYGSLFKIDGVKMYITKKSNKSIGLETAMQLVIDEESEQYIKKLSKFKEKKKDMKNAKVNSIYDKITKEENVFLYEKFVFKLTNTIYQKKMSIQAKLLSENVERFKEQCIEDQVDSLLNILGLFRKNCQTNLTAFGGAGKTGTLTIGKNIPEQTSIEIINQSVTGFFENVVDIKKL